MRHRTISIIGAGPAGLTAAYLLASKGFQVTVLEADPVYVGGISRTARYKGFHFDIGGHRFFTKSERVEKFWDEILPHDFLSRPRSSRIYYHRHFFSYPLRAFEALKKLGIIESSLCLLSYLKARFMPITPVKSFEDWVVNQFGRRLFTIFFKTYTEKVWGIKCSEISADWAAQRIKGLSLGKAILHGFLPRRVRQGNEEARSVIKTLITSFQYPRKGPGMLWEACADKIRAMGGTICMGCKVVGLEYAGINPRWIVKYLASSDKHSKALEVDEVICSAAMRDVALMIEPPLSEEGRQAAKRLKYRDFLTVVLILKDRNRFSDNWIYIHEPNVRVGRIQNFKSWSPEMIPDPTYTSYGLEYFCNEHDQLWNKSDRELIELAKGELAHLGLAAPSEIVDGCVARQAKAYPVYADEYLTNVGIIRHEIENKYPGLHLVGRNGMHKYNNQDHAVMTAMLTVENIIAERAIYDVWAVNQDAEYLETYIQREANKT